MNNIERIRQKLPEQEYGALLITSPVNARYSTGFAASAAVLLIAAGGAWYFTDMRYIEAAKAAINQAHVCLKPQDETYPELIKTVLEENNITSVGFEDGTMTYADYLNWNEKLGAELVPAQKLLTDLRMIKSESELEKMIKAQRISEKSFEDILPLISTDITEKQLANELIGSFLRNGADDKGYDPIVVSGTKSSMPHGVPGDVKISKGFLTIDFGARFDGWLSDTTRTVCVGKPDDQMINVYDTVLKAQAAAIAAVRGGVLGRDVDAAARTVIENAGYGDYFGHGTGHGIGLEVHEMPRASKICDSDIPTGTMITIEPGIYLPGRYGVRIEDTVCATENGCENITNLPKELLILEP